MYITRRREISMKYYITYSYSIDDEYRSDIKSAIVDFKYYIECSKDLKYLKTELLEQLRKEKVAEEISDKNLFILNFYLLKEETIMPDDPVKYLITFYLEYESLVIDKSFYRTFSKILSRPTYLETESEMLATERAIIEDLNEKNAGIYRAKNVAIINYIQLE